MEFGQIKRAILANSFMDELRGNSIIDKVAFNELCDRLRELASIWRVSSIIDKELMQELYVLSVMTLYQWLLPSWSENERKQLWDMFVELDNLVLECLASD